MSQHGAKRFHSAESDVVLFRYSLARPRYPGGWASGKLGSLRISPRLAAPVPPIVCSAIRTRICNSSSSSSWAMSVSSCSRRTATSYVRLKRYIASPYLLPFPECRPVDHREILARVRKVAHLHLARCIALFSVPACSRSGTVSPRRYAGHAGPIARANRTFRNALAGFGSLQGHGLIRRRAALRDCPINMVKFM